MLKSIGYGHDTQLKKETIRILSRFKLFGLILHDPNSHPKFHEKLKEIFPKLDYLTGNKFLFFSLTNPPVDWRENNKRDYFSIWEENELLSPQNAYETIDESISSYTIAKTLNIEYKNLPCIILTNDFSSNKFLWVKTNEAHLEKQLTEIGYFCNNRFEEKVNIGDDDFKALIRNIDLCSGYEIRMSYSSLSNLLSDFLSFVSVKLNYIDSSDAIKNINNILYSFGSKKERFANHDKYFEDKCLSLLGSLVHLDMPQINKIEYVGEAEQFYERMWTNDGGQSSGNNSILQNSLESECKIIWKTLEVMEKIYPNFKKEDEEFDFTPLAIGYFKIFENEINFSVVHWVRKLLQIEMPVYFNKVKPGFNNSEIAPTIGFSNKPRPVNFNRSVKGSWVAPGLGESEIIVNSLINGGKNIEEMEPFQPDLMENWQKIRTIRNLAAHPGVLSYKEYQNTKNTFDYLISSGIFNRLFKLKQLYRGS